MMAEGRLLRVTVLASAALHVVMLGLVAHGGLGRPIALDDLRVVSVGTYTPAPPRPEFSLPKALERRPPAPKHPRQPPPGAFVPQPHPIPQVPTARPEPPRPIEPRPLARTLPVPAPHPLASVTPSNPPPAPAPAPAVPQPVRPAPATPRPEPTRMAQAPPHASLVPAAASGNSGGRLNTGSASAAGTVPVAGGGTPVGHVPNEGTGGSGSGSGDVPRGRGSAEPTPDPVRPDRPGPPVAAPVRDPDPPPAPRMVTVSICRKSGLLAGRHCAEFGGPVLEKSFVAGQQPDDHCNLCKPPPLTAPDPEHNNRSLEAREAKLLKDADPEVPEELAEVHGTVTIRYWVDEHGRVVDPSVVSSCGNKALDECAKRAVKKMRYQAAEQGGARRIQAEKTFRF